jgi:hypothetical protein
MDNWTWQDWLVTALTLTLVLAVLLYKFRYTIQLNRKGLYADGTIVNWMSTQEAGKRYFYPLILFVTATGQEIKFRAEERCEDEPLYPMGTNVRVKYLANLPSIRKVEYPVS